MFDGHISPPRPQNEPVLDYAPGSPERSALARQVAALRAQMIEIPAHIGGEDVFTGQRFDIVCPHEHARVLARAHAARREEVLRAIDSAEKARAGWAALPFHARAAIFLRAAEALAGERRPLVNAATMLGQSKTPHQAEIDAVCELADFLRFNVWYAEQLYRMQPSSAPQTWNMLDYRPLEGFVLAISPFNFSSIACNLAAAPALLGNVVLWKPAEEATYAAHVCLRLLIDAGLPPGVINLLPGPGAPVGEVALTHPDLAGVNFTGSTATFQHLWRTVGAAIERFRSYPRLVGETGGKDFIVAHASADPQALVTAVLRGAYEYQGQKCSALSRLFVPAALYTQIRAQLIEQVEALSMGDPTDFQTFVGAVISRRAFDKVSAYLDYARAANDAEIVAGGQADATVGFFVRPTLIEARQPHDKLLREEIFGPVLTIYAYPDGAFEQVLDTCDRGTPYGLTGAIFARDRGVIELACARLRYAAGNFYINDKPTGAVVDQQPFGGSRASGTNDKAGTPFNLLRWVSPRTIKENFVPPLDYRYPYMTSE